MARAARTGGCGGPWGVDAGGVEGMADLQGGGPCGLCCRRSRGARGIRAGDANRRELLLPTGRTREPDTSDLLLRQAYRGRACACRNQGLPEVVLLQDAADRAAEGRERGNL